MDLSNITIAYPVYDRVGPLELSLKGIPAEFNGHILLISDSSPFNAFQEYRRIASLDTRIRLIELPQKNSLARLWNQAIIHSPTDWVMINNDDIDFTENLWKQIPIDIENKTQFDLIAYRWFGCFLMHKRTIAKIGWFDERFETGTYEDTDYFQRIARAKLPMLQYKDNNIAKHMPDFQEYRDLFPGVFSDKGGWAHLDKPNVLFFTQKWKAFRHHEYTTVPLSPESFYYSWDFKPAPPTIEDIDWHPYYTNKYRMSYSIS